MSLGQKRDVTQLEEDRREAGKAQGLEEGPSLKLPRAEEAQEVRSGPPVRVQGNPEEGAAPGVPAAPQSPPGELAALQSSPSQEARVSCPEAEGPSTSEEPGGARAALQAALPEKMAELVWFLLLKYRAKEPVSRAEMLQEVLGNDRVGFREIFRQVCECLQLVFGVDVKKADPRGQSYVLSTTLGLSHDGLLSPEETMPKTGLLLFVLGLILMEGDVATEERVWASLREMGVRAGREHPIYGEPRALLTRVWVREQYLELRRVPYGEPARYEFLWGPRAHAEVNVVKVLDFMLKVNSVGRRCFRALSDEAVGDEGQGQEE